MQRTDFGALASRYDELRAADDLWWRTTDALVEAGDLRGRRVLDIGCGTGKLAAALDERYGCKVWGVDPEPKMLEVARGRVPPSVGLKQGEAEALPFRDGWFERATMTLVYHHVDPARALPEVRRVLAEAGRLAFLTFDPAHFVGYYMNRFFPSFLEVDLRRFDPPDAIERDLAGAGFERVAITRLHLERTIDRETALAKMRGKHISTFQLISDEEYRDGLARAERELPATVRYEYHWLVVAAIAAGGRAARVRARA